MKVIFKAKAQNAALLLLVLIFAVFFGTIGLFVLHPQLNTAGRIIFWGLLGLILLFFIYSGFLQRREKMWIDDKKILHSKHSGKFFPFYRKVEAPGVTAVELVIMSVLKGSSAIPVQSAKDKISAKIDEAVLKFQTYSDYPDISWASFTIQYEDNEFEVILDINKLELQVKGSDNTVPVSLSGYSVFKTVLDLLKENKPRLTWKYGAFFTPTRGM